MSIATLDELFLHSLKDMLYAERKNLIALPRMERKATDPNLKAALSSHRQETEAHILRLEQVFDSIGKHATCAECDAMTGLIEEANSLLPEIEDAEIMDAALISLSQAVEHYEIARYGTLVSWAKQLGNRNAAALLKSTLDEECANDKALSRIAEEHLNQMAAA